MPLEAPPTQDPLRNAVLDDTNIKEMAAKFRQLTTPDPAPTPPKADDPKPTPPAPPVGAPSAPPSQPPVSAPPKAGEGATPPAVPAADDPPEPPPNAPLTREHFKRLAQARDSHRQIAETIRKEHEMAMAKLKVTEEELTKVKAALPPNLDEVQKSLADAKRIADENKQLNERLEIIAFEQSPRFQTWWRTETGKHIKVAQQHVPPAERDALAKLLLEPASVERDTALTTLVEKLPGVAQRIINGALEGMDVLRLQREEALSSNKAARELQAHESTEREKEATAREQRRQSLTESALKQARSYSAFQPTGDPAHDAEIPQREQFIRAAIAGKLSDDVTLALPAISVEYLHLTERVIPALRAEVAKQTELIKQLQAGGVRPSEGTGAKGGKSAAAEDAEKKGTSFAEKVRALMTS